MKWGGEGADSENDMRAIISKMYASSIILKRGEIKNKILDKQRKTEF